MGIQEGIVMLLNADTTVSGLVGANSIIPVGVVMGVKSPLIVYHIGTALDTLDTEGSTGYRTARFQFDCYSTLSYTEVKAVAKAVRHALQNFKNEILADADGTFVQGCLIDFESDMPFVSTGIKTIEYRVMVQISVFYLEIPTGTPSTGDGLLLLENGGEFQVEGA
jgi:hypothetical protein